MEQLSVLINERYNLMMVRWIEHDLLSMALSIAMAIFLFLSHQFIAFGGSDYEQSTAGLVGLAINATVFFIAFWFELYSTKVSACVCMVIVKGQTWRQR